MGFQIIGLLGQWVVKPVGGWINGLSSQWVVGSMGCQTSAWLDRWDVKPVGCWANGLSNQRVVGVMGCHTSGLLDHGLSENGMEPHLFTHVRYKPVNMYQKEKLESYNYGHAFGGMPPLILFGSWACALFHLAPSLKKVFARKTVYLQYCNTVLE